MTFIYNGANGLNIRKAPSITAEVDQIVHAGTFAVISISAGAKWYKLESGLFITAILDLRIRKEPGIFFDYNKKNG